MRAATTCTANLGIYRIALFLPYIEEVNEPLRVAFVKGGFMVDVFGNFSEPEETKVARISTPPIVDNETLLGANSAAGAVFLSQRDASEAGAKRITLRQKKNSRKN